MVSFYREYRIELYRRGTHTPCTKKISALISLSTIGFGDMVPMVEPPLMYADAVRNESGQLFIEYN